MKLLRISKNRHVETNTYFIAALLLFLFAFGPELYAQSPTNERRADLSLSLGQRLGLQAVHIDSSGMDSSQVLDTMAVKSRLKSPLIAVLLSAAIPGGGQVYNGSYWKVPIIIGAQVYFVSQWLSNNKSYEYYRTEYAKSISVYPPLGNTNLKDLRDAYRDQRDSFAWYVAGVYLLSMVDAYVDAELSGFEVSPNLSSTPAGTTVAIAFRLRF